MAASQSVVPHAQLAGLAAVPFLVAQVGTELQRSSFDVSQMSPVADVQAPEVPQTQGVGLAVAPSPWVQAGHKHTENPDRVTEASEIHVIASPALTLPPSGPFVPEYCVPFTVSMS